MLLKYILKYTVLGCRVSFCAILVGDVPQDFVNVKNVPQLERGWKPVLNITSKASQDKQIWTMRSDVVSLQQAAVVLANMC